MKRSGRSSWRLLCLVLALLGCPSSSGPGSGAPGLTNRDPLEGIALVSRKVSPRGPPAKVYGEPVQHRLAPSEQAILDALRPLQLPHCPALSKMTREVARVAPDHVNIPPKLLDSLMAWAGLPYPQPRLVLVQLPDDPDGCHRNMGPACVAAIASIVEQAQTQIPDDGGFVCLGAGVAPSDVGATRLMLAILDRSVDLQPLPTTAAVGADVLLKGRLAQGRNRPTLEVVGPTGRMMSMPVSVSVDGTFETTIPCGPERGVHQVEVLADGPHGPEVAANFPLHCGVSFPKTIEIELERVAADVTPQQIAHANFVFLNEERARRGLPQLQWDERAADVAARHSADMARNGFVGHRSPNTGDVRDRFEAARLKGSVIRENVARGYGPKGIHESLMNSPGHRVNVLAPDVTHVGIGVVIGPPESNVVGVRRPLFATQNYFRKPGAGTPAQDDLVPAMQSRVETTRKRLGLRAPVWNPHLTDAAGELARMLARGRKPTAQWEKKLFLGGFSTVDTHRAESADFEALGGLEVWSKPRLEAGIGFAKVGRGDEARLLIVVLVGEH